MERKTVLIVTIFVLIAAYLVAIYLPDILAIFQDPFGEGFGEILTDGGR